MRMCIDYRGLNSKTIKKRYPLPRTEDMLDRLPGAKVFNKIDIRQAYNQVKIYPRDIEKTAFRTRHGHYEYLVMPFGLTNAPATFQQLMNDVLQPYLDKFVIVYLDDMQISSNTVEEHERHPGQVLQALQTTSCMPGELMRVLHNPSQLPGTRRQRPRTADGIIKVKAINDWPAPTNVTKVKSFLGQR